MEEVNDGLDMFHLEKGRAIASMLDTMRQLEAIDKVKYEPEEIEAGMDFKMRMTFYLIGVFDAQVEQYSKQLLGGLPSSEHQSQTDPS